MVFLGFQDCCEWRISFFPFFVGWAVAALQLPYVMCDVLIHAEQRTEGAGGFQPDTEATLKSL